MPKVSVIMPAYNAEKYIAEAIDSILGQTFGDFEFIILNDCSKDRTEEIILSYKDERIVYLKNEQNMGVAATLNKGLEVAKGEYIARMDADDISMPERFEKQVAYLDNNPQTVVCGSAIMPFSEEGNQPVRQFAHDPAKAKVELLYAPCVAHPVVMIRADVLRKNQITYYLDLEGSEDFGLWWELAKHGDIVSLPWCLLHYRVHLKQASRNSDHKRAAFRLFVDQRMKDLGLTLTSEEIKVFFRYTCAELSGASYEELMCFIDVMLRVYAANRTCGFFDSKALKKSLRGAVHYCISKANITQEEKKNAYRTMQQGGLSVSFLRIKQWVRSQIG
jgi:glycosyltransferase involved in cell wall biosynthesis